MDIRDKKLGIFWVPAFLVTAWCGPALAGNTQQDAERSAARRVGYEGVQAYESGDIGTAVDKLGRAFQLVRMPTVGLWYARALAKSGKLVEASERYAEVARLEVTEGKVKEQKQAQADAANELEALKPRIPNVTLSVAGAAQGCEVILDGNVVPMSMLDIAAPINPGAHHVQAKQGGEVVERDFTVGEGETKAMTLTLKSTKLAALEPTKAPRAEARSHSSDDGSSSKSKSNASTQGTIGWVTLGVGAAATVVGTVAGILVLSKRSQLDSSDNCDKSRAACDTVEHDRINSYNQMRTVSTIGFIGGAVGLAVGTTLLITRPKPKEPGMSAWLGIGSVGITGSFQ